MSDTTPTNDAHIVTKKESVEVITGDGKSLQGSKNLEAIFDKIQSGTHDSDSAIKEVMSNQPSKPDEPDHQEDTPAPAEEPKQEPVKEEPEPTEDKTLDDALTTGQKKNEIVVPPAKEEEVSEDDLRVLAHDKPKTAKRISALLGKVAKEAEARTTTQKERDEQAAKVKELEEKLASVQTVNPETQAQIDEQLKELVQYRRRYELEKDPEVVNRFDSKIKNGDAAVYETLKRHNAGEGLLKTIQDEGGWEAFADSKKLIHLKGDEDPITASDLAKRIMEALPYSEQRAINSAIDQKHTASRERKQYFEEETKKANEYFAQREELTKKQREEWDNNHKAALKQVEDFNKSLVDGNEWLRQKPIPSNATAEQRAQIEEDNKWAKQIDSERIRYSNAKDMKEILGVVEDAVKFHHERHVNSRLTAKVEKLQQELDALRSAGRTVKKQGSIAAGSSSSSEVAKPKQARSLDDAFDAIAQGRDPNEE
jgi:hypothetical protein